MSTKSKIPKINKLTYGKSIIGTQCKEVTKTELKEKLKSYRKGLDDNETRSCLLYLDEIKYLIDYYTDRGNLNGNNPIDCLRVYFFREDLNREYPSTNDKITKVGDRGQMSIIVVPANNYENKYPDMKNAKNGFCSADDMFNEEEKCLVLTPGGEHTGLCPNNCEGSI